MVKPGAEESPAALLPPEPPEPHSQPWVAQPEECLGSRQASSTPGLGKQHCLSGLVRRDPMKQVDSALQNCCFVMLGSDDS